MNLKLVKAVCFDFDGVFTDNIVITDQHGTEYVSSSRGDGLGLQKLLTLDIPVYIISTETNPVVQARARKLGITAYTSIDNKLSCLEDISTFLSIPLSSFMFVGNDINDFDAMSSVGFPVSPADALPEIKNISCFVTSASGGRGAVREICELVYKAYSSNIAHRPVSFPSFSSLGPRDWGEELLLVHSPFKYTLKKITILKGKRGGLQYHRFKDEAGYILSGTLKILCQDTSGALITHELKAGEWFHFPATSIHQEIALTDVEILEVSTPHFNDRVRVESQFGLNGSGYGLPTTSASEVQFR
jgi:3-deoxy-D-manno-octulosonate 8-phosphate phosphatase (KDO 8-P phosphatase)